jgi:nitrogen fixation protein NifU and related proteins
VTPPAERISAGSGAAALYHATLLDRDRHPRHFGPLAEATHTATLDNPLCGDLVTMRLVVAPAAAAAGAAASSSAVGASSAAARARIIAAAFEGRGCAVSRASASLWAELLHQRAATSGADVASIAALIDRFARFVAEPPEAPLPEELGELVVLAGVRAVKSRRLCATLASRALAAALAAPAAAPSSPR